MKARKIRLYGSALATMALACFGLLWGCEKSAEKSQAETTESDAGPKDNTVVVDPSIAKAVAAASANVAKKRSPQSGGENSPPPHGIFEPGQADKQLRIGEAPKVTLGSTGLAPRVDLSKSRFVPGRSISGSVQVMIQGNPRQRGLPIDFKLTLTAKEISSAAVPGASGEKTVEVTAQVIGAQVAASSGVPPQLQTKVGALKGSKVLFDVLQNGAASNFRHQLGTTGPADLEEHLRALSDALATVILPYPDQPVGSGAYWMATSRDGVMGLDLVTYRLVKLERVEQNVATLNLSTKRYATSKDFKLAALEGEFTLEEFTSTAEGSLEASSGSPMPLSGNVELLLACQVLPKGKPANQRAERGSVTVQSRARLDFAGKKAAPGGGP